MEAYSVLARVNKLLATRTRITTVNAVFGEGWHLSTYMFLRTILLYFYERFCSRAKTRWIHPERREEENTKSRDSAAHGGFTTILPSIVNGKACPIDSIPYTLCSSCSFALEQNGQVHQRR